MDKKITVKLKEENVTRLIQKKRPGESYDDVLERLFKQEKEQ